MDAFLLVIFAAVVAKRRLHRSNNKLREEIALVPLAVPGNGEAEPAQLP